MNVLRYAANFLGLEVTDAYAANTFDAVYPHSQNAILQRQDQCVQAFGDAYTSNICTPGNTLCCVRRSAALPACVQALEIGWCCTADGGCYTDLSSACGQPGAVSCTQLGPNTNKACCPANTVCAPGYNATNDFVRCNIPSSRLSSLAVTSTSLQGVSAATSKTSLSVSTQDDGQIITVTPSGGNVPSTTLSMLMTSTASTDPESTKTSTYTTITSTPTPTPSPETFTLTAGDIAGIAIGSAGAVLLVLAGIWYIRRRRRRAPPKRDEITSRQPPPAYDDKVLYGSYTSPDVRAELSSQRDPAELPQHYFVKYNQSPQELEG